jgi:hypothetical protein
MSRVAQDWPKRAAQAFHRTARAILLERGEAGTSTRLAELVGEYPQKYSNVLNGREGTLDRVHRWVRRWAANDMPPLELRLTADTVTVERHP